MMNHMEYTTFVVKFKKLCDHSDDAYILACGAITVPSTGPAAVRNNRKHIVIKNCALFTNCIREISNTKIDNAEDINILMSMYNLIEYTDNYSKTFRSSWDYYGPFLDVSCSIVDYASDDNNSASFKF